MRNLETIRGTSSSTLAIDSMVPSKLALPNEGTIRADSGTLSVDSTQSSWTSGQTGDLIASGGTCGTADVADLSRTGGTVAVKRKRTN